LRLAKSRAPKGQAVYRDGLSREELDAYTREVRAADIPVPAKTILLLLPQTGLRISEACALHWSRQKVDSKGRRAFDIVGKRNKMRRVTFNGAATEVLLLYCSWPKAPKTDYLFPSELAGKAHYSPAAVRHALRQVRGRAVTAGRWQGRLAGITPHILRHTFASHLIDLGVALPVVKNLLGHENVSTTMGYLHPSQDTMQAAVDQLDARATPRPARVRH
jgi:integrase/recombinase XerC